MTVFSKLSARVTFIAVLFFTLSGMAQAAGSVDHSKWQSILDNYLVSDASQHRFFKYGEVSDDDFDLLESYIEDMQNIDIKSYSKDEQFAYWVNVYNAVTIYVVVEDYPVSSIMQIGSVEGKGPWDDGIFETADQTLTLNDIEHGILRKQFPDNRVHYAVNCASLGCPNLSPKAYTPENMEQQLEQGAKQFINSAKGVNFVDDKLVLSSIYSWFVSDFGGNETSLLTHLKKYASDELKSKLDSHFGAIEYDYNWQLNEK